MELTYQWFWLVKLGFVLVTMGVAYQAFYVKRFNSKSLNVLFITLVVLSYMSPIKMNPTTNIANTNANHQIKSMKVELPPKSVDDSFKTSTKIQGITKEDLK